MENCIAKTRDIYQVVSAVRNLDKVLENWFQLVEFNHDSIKYYLKDESGADGIEIHSVYRGQEIDYRIKAVRFDFGGVDLMLVEPLNKDGGDPYSDYVRAYGNGFHHISVGVSNLEQALNSYKELGFEPLETAANGVLFDMQDAMGPVMALTEQEYGPLGPRDESGKTL